MFITLQSFVSFSLGILRHIFDSKVVIGKFLGFLFFPLDPQRTVSVVGR